LVYSATEKKTIFGLRVSPGSAETLVRRGGIANHLSIEYSLSNIYAKKYQNCLRCVKVIVCNISVIFFETQCIIQFYCIAQFCTDYELDF